MVDLERLLGDNVFTGSLAEDPPYTSGPGEVLIPLPEGWEALPELDQAPSSQQPELPQSLPQQQPYFHQAPSYQPQQQPYFQASSSQQQPYFQAPSYQPQQLPQQQPYFQASSSQQQPYFQAPSYQPQQLPQQQPYFQASSSYQQPELQLPQQLPQHLPQQPELQLPQLQLAQWPYKGGVIQINLRKDKYSLYVTGNRFARDIKPAFAELSDVEITRTSAFPLSKVKTPADIRAFTGVGEDLLPDKPLYTSHEREAISQWLHGNFCRTPAEFRAAMARVDVYDLSKILQ